MVEKVGQLNPELGLKGPSLKSEKPRATGLASLIVITYMWTKIPEINTPKNSFSHYFWNGLNELIIQSF